jgi:folate-binding protein YgfZ
MYCELRDVGLISVSGPDAASFLHAQLTSDVAGIHGERIQYSGYCSPKGRLLATLLLWRTPDEILLQLPAPSAVSMRPRLAKYVLRSRVKLEDASPRFRLHGIAGPQAHDIADALTGGAPGADHDIVRRNEATVARLSSRRYLVLSSAGAAQTLEGRIGAPRLPLEAWARLDVEDGVPWITEESEDRYIPQMVNLDLLGGVSFGKGCYPGQEIVARTHYLGRLKQRMYRLKVAAAADAPRPGDPLYSPRFGPEQACGTLVNVVSLGDGTHEMLGVVRIDSVVDGTIHWKDPDGAVVEFLPLPYSLPV